MKIRKILTLGLAMVLLLGTLSIATATFTDTDGNPHEDAIIEMARLGILEGVGNNLFIPDAELNRAAAAKVASYLLGYNDADAIIAAQKSSPFTDVENSNSRWAHGWINLMADEGILQGVGDGRYAPDAPLQMVQWAAILIRVLEHNQPGMAWPSGYNEMAEFLGIDRGMHYEGSRILTRAEMARMTTTALYAVSRPDNKRIFDIVTFKADPLDSWDIADAPESHIYNDPDMNIELSSPIVAPGGGSNITITVTATYGPNRLPATNAQIEFFANVGPNDRRNQLSSTVSITDSTGKATSVYTTLASDDNQSIEFLANIQSNNEWVDRRAFAIASNTAALVSGRVTNPFDGSALDDPKIIVALASNPHIHSKLTADATGNYSAPINAGVYGIDFRFNVGKTFPFSGDYGGSHFSINSNGDVWMALSRTFASGSTYTLPSEMGVVTAMTSLAPGTDLYLTLKGSNFTRVATVGSNGRIMIAIEPGTYVINNRFGGTLKDNITIQKGTVNDLGNI